jgi:hypothetical protein
MNRRGTLALTALLALACGTTALTGCDTVAADYSGGGGGLVIVHHYSGPSIVVHHYAPPVRVYTRRR